MPKKRGIAFDRHVELGNQLVRMHEEILALRLELETAYGKSKNVVEFAQEVNSYLVFLRASLEKAAYDQHGRTINATKLYFGPR